MSSYSLPSYGDGRLKGNSELQHPAQLNQVVDYSEFLNELAAQRHTVLRKYSGYPDHAKRLTDLLDALIRDVLRHIEGSDLRLDGSESKGGL